MLLAPVGLACRCNSCTHPWRARQLEQLLLVYLVVSSGDSEQRAEARVPQDSARFIWRAIGVWRSRRSKSSAVRIPRSNSSAVWIPRSELVLLTDLQHRHVYVIQGCHILKKSWIFCSCPEKCLNFVSRSWKLFLRFRRALPKQNSAMFVFFSCFFFFVEKLVLCDCPKVITVMICLVKFFQKTLLLLLIIGSFQRSMYKLMSIIGRSGP